MKLLLTLSLLVTLALPGLTLAELPPQVESDFSGLNGYIIMPIGDEFLVDLDASVNLQEGDILTLIMPGEKVVHPISKEILGSLDIPQGYLQVTRIKSGYSYAKLLFSETPPQKGDQVRRFEQVPSAFHGDNTENASTVEQQLKTGLPQLNWLAEGSAVEPLLNFTLDKGTLTITNASDITLKSYRVSEGKLLAPVKAGSRATAFETDLEPEAEKSKLNTAVNNMLESIGLGMNKDDDLPAGIIRQAEKTDSIWYGPQISGNPAGISVADLDGDGSLETAVALEGQVLIGRIQQGQFQRLANIDTPGLKLLSLDSIDLNNDNKAELYLTAARGTNLASLVIEYAADAYSITIADIPWYLRVTETVAKGRSLVGDKQGITDQPSSTQPFFVIRDGNSLSEGEPLELPDYASIFSFLPFTQEGSEPALAYLSKGDYLKVANSAGEELWESNDYFGGSEISFLDNEDYNELIEPIYIRPRIMKTAAGDILVSQNDGLRTLQRFRRFKNSRIVALRWSGYALEEQWRTSSQKGYLADFTLADADNDGQNELTMIVQYKHKGPLQKPRSAIVIYELN